MKAYVIKRDDGKYLSKNTNYDYRKHNKRKKSWTNNILNAKKFMQEPITSYQYVPVTIVEGDIQELQNQKAVEALKEALNYAIKHYNEEETDMKVAVAYRKCATKISELLEEYGGNE